MERWPKEIKFCFSILNACLLFSPAFLSGGEIRIVRTSGGFDPAPIPIVAFFGEELTVQLSISGDPESLLGKNVLYAVFQRARERIVPLGDTVKGGKVELSEDGALVSALRIQVPELSGHVQLAVKAQIEGVGGGAVINLFAQPDDILEQLVERQVQFTDAKTVEDAFLERAFEAPTIPLDELDSGRKWRGVWFVGTPNTNSEKILIPDSLKSDQVLVIYGENQHHFPYPIAIQKGEGWVLYFNRTWFDEFSTNAGLQSAFLQTINQLTAQ